MKKIIKFTIISLSINLAFALYNSVIGFISHSWWFIILGAYFFVLSITRFALLKIKKRSNDDLNLEVFARKFTGIMLIILSLTLAGMVVLSIVKDRGLKYHEIVMITIALYSFVKITLAIINLVAAKKDDSPVTKALRNISLCDAAVSIFALQRSMLVSFGEMTHENIRLFNILTGSTVCILVFILGLNLLGGRRINMAKSKIVKANEKIAEAVTGSYKKLENAVVKGYTKIEDKFVDQYLTRDGETVEEAKKRLKK